MLRLSSVAAGVSLIAFSTLAFAGADNTTNEGSALSPTASEGGRERGRGRRKGEGEGGGGGG